MKMTKTLGDTLGNAAVNVATSIANNVADLIINAPPTKARYAIVADAEKAEKIDCIILNHNGNMPLKVLEDKLTPLIGENPLSVFEQYSPEEFAEKKLNNGQNDVWAYKILCSSNGQERIGIKRQVSRSTIQYNR